MEQSGVKKVELIDGGKSYDIEIDFDNGRVIRLQDKAVSLIKKVVGNVIYLDIDSDYENVIVYDDKFAFMGEINARNMCYSQPMGIWLMPKNKTLFFEVAKNACTSIVSEIYNSNWKKWWAPKISTDKSDIWALTQWNNSYFLHKMLVSEPEYEQKKQKYGNFMKFLVYDDPVKRFLRMINNKYINHHSIASIVNPPYDKNIHDFVDKVILAAKLDSLNSLFWDQHLAPISTSGKKYLDDITDFCWLKDLSSFFEEKFSIKIKRYNAMPNSKKVVTLENLLPRQLEEIKELYAQDYEIPIKYADKFYKT